MAKGKQEKKGIEVNTGSVRDKRRRNGDGVEGGCEGVRGEEGRT